MNMDLYTKSIIAVLALAVLPEQVWINKPNEVDIKSIRAVNSLEGIGGSQNGFHHGVIKNERESGRAPGRG